MDYCEKNFKQIKHEIESDKKLKANEMLTLCGYFTTSELLIEILKGVQYLHEKNIIHGDLKLENILLTENSSGNYVKIADFGLSKVRESEKTNTADEDMAPTTSSIKSDFKEDIRSFGFIMKEMFFIDMNE